MKMNGGTNHLAGRLASGAAVIFVMIQSVVYILESPKGTSESYRDESGRELRHRTWVEHQALCS
jgi:hypothetical protein